ncbi:glycerol-3-phosphate 1-O-acyltransferase PlsB [Kangiella sediminilitoris]|uniref:Glycerol-3-phosphate acyltransferase n=1 Tax=Kangiella sediminilitoris TaxID=1144748 RepID=A0A1B3B7R1_9GAMM|nr:glycerol-3-phosphate 1-O-acyltransferase PlsB [Kangiella sediminilitoris]AOE48816.1 Glycerol-3-phosphate acyltransferase [Kangiella sediminilitoris]
MSLSSGLKHFSLALLRLPLKLLVREKRAPTDPQAEFHLSSDDHIVYVLRTQSMTSIELLRRQGVQLELPVGKATDQNLSIPAKGSCLFLNNRPSIFRRHKENDAHKSSIVKLLKAQKANPEINYKLVPVSVYWGRNPGKEKSFLRYFISSIEESGYFGKFLILLFSGRQCLLQYGQPIQLNSPDINLDLEPFKNAHKISRILRVHFNRAWVATVGPRTENRRELIDGIVAADSVQQVIQREQSKGKNKRSAAEMEKEAGKYVKEIAANFSPRMIRFLSGLLTRVWYKIYAGIEVNNLRQVRQMAKDHEIIYVPCHRSHADYLLLSYQLYHEGLAPPHIAAGINLNFWPVGSILRRGGAFFLRRSFRGNRLYTAVFNEYLYRLFNKGIPVEYFQEGGRSRTGRLLSPKTGMLAMTVQSLLRGLKKPILFVPVYIGYERMFEGKSYVGELRGKRKQKESFGQLLGVRKALKRFYGKVYLNFGEPLNLQEFLQQRNIDWRDASNNQEERPEWMSNTVAELGDEINRRINSASSVNSICLVSLSLLATPRQAMDKNELISHLDMLITLAKSAPYSDYTNLPQNSGQELLQTALKLGMVQEFTDPAGDVVFIEGDEAILSTYYSNNILHIYALPSLIAAVFQRHDHVTRDEIKGYVKLIYPFLYQELYIRWHRDDVSQQVDKIIESLISLGLLQEKGTKIHSATDEDPNWSRLMTLAQAIQPALQRYAISLTMLHSLQDHETLRRAELEQESQKLAQRIAALHSINAPEFFDKNLFKNLAKVLKDEGWVHHKEGSGMRPTQQCETLYSAVLNLLSVPLQQGLQKASRSLRQSKMLSPEPVVEDKAEEKS